MSAPGAAPAPGAVVLVRHAETESNAARILQWPDTPLSARGVAQAERLAARLARWPIAQVVSSDYARARATAECVARAANATLSLDPGLQERNFGLLRGTAYQDLTSDLFAPGYTPPGGESWEDLHARADAAWERIARLAAGTQGHVVVVTHGLVCHSLVSRRFELAPGVQAPAGYGNTSVTWIEPGPPWRIALAACLAHLEGSELAPTRRPAPVA